MHRSLTDSAFVRRDTRFNRLQFHCRVSKFQKQHQGETRHKEDITKDMFSAVNVEWFGERITYHLSGNDSLSLCRTISVQTLRHPTLMFLVIFFVSVTVSAHLFPSKSMNTARIKTLYYFFGMTMSSYAFGTEIASPGEVEFASHSGVGVKAADASFSFPTKCSCV